MALCGCSRQEPPGSFPGAPGSYSCSRQAAAAELGAAAAAMSCLEPQGPPRGIDWHFVGVGQGGFDKAVNYDYVGQGAGSYEPRESTTYYGWKFRNSFIGLLMILVLAGAVVLAVLILAPITTTTTALVGVSGTSPPSSPKYDCNSTAHMGRAKGKYCCERFSMHCATPPPSSKPAAPTPPSLHTSEFNCSVGFEHWIQDWPIAKKSFCCRHLGKGCPPKPGVVEQGADGPAKSKVSAHHGQQTETTTHFPVDCGEGWANWERGWSRVKKEWCCKHESKACASEKRL